MNINAETAIIYPEMRQYNSTARGRFSCIRASVDRRVMCSTCTRARAGEEQGDIADG